MKRLRRLTKNQLLDSLGKVMYQQDHTHSQTQETQSTLSAHLHFTLMMSKFLSNSPRIKRKY
jgi:hypothetical protein